MPDERLIYAHFYGQEANFAAVRSRKGWWEFIMGKGTTGRLLGYKQRSSKLTLDISQGVNVIPLWKLMPFMAKSLPILQDEGARFAAAHCP